MPNHIDVSEIDTGLRHLKTWNVSVNSLTKGRKLYVYAKEINSSTKEESSLSTIVLRIRIDESSKFVTLTTMHLMNRLVREDIAKKTFEVQHHEKKVPILLTVTYDDIEKSMELICRYDGDKIESMKFEYPILPPGSDMILRK